MKQPGLVDEILCRKKDVFLSNMEVEMAKLSAVKDKQKVCPFSLL